MDFYNRFNPAKNYDRHLFRADKTLQAAELNELQSSVLTRMATIGNVLFSDGAIIRDAGCIVDAGTGTVQLQSGALYLAGAVRGIGSASLPIAMTGSVVIGVYLQEAVITELEDPALLNPAVGTRGYMEPGAARLQVNPVWGVAGDGQSGEFYPVYEVVDGILKAKEAPPSIDAVSVAIQKYDRDSTGGTYAIAGLNVSVGGVQAGDRQVYRVKEGSARIDGHQIELAAGRGLVFDAQPDRRLIDSEPHQSTGSGAIRINTDCSPIHAISSVHITTEKTAAVVHGAYLGALDLLPDTSVIEIVAVTQGATTYQKNVDYKLTAGKVDWSLSGVEPAPGSTYSVTYKHIKAVAPTNPDATGFTVSGAVAGTLVLVTYEYKVPRVDVICLDTAGDILALRGVASDFMPHPPSVPRNLLLLATVRQSWSGSPAVTNAGTRMVPMDVLDRFDERLNRLTMLIARSRLESNAIVRDASLKKSIFVDPFLDDSMRDAGIPQTAAIVGGALTLPVRLAARYFGSDVAVPTLLEHDVDFAVVQARRTSAMAVNPYNSFAQIPARITLSPACDQMTYPVTEWASDLTNRVVQHLAYGASAGPASSETVDTLSVTTVSDQLIRPQIVEFTIAGFGPNEPLARVAFDNVDVQPVTLTDTAAAPVANAQGEVAGRFRIPAGIPVGVKQVQFVGAGGSYGVAYFTAASWQENKVLQRVVTEYVYEFDPPPPPPPVVAVQTPAYYSPAVAADWSYSPPPADPPARSAVEGLYQDFIGRNPEPGGAAYWQSQIDAGLSGSALVEAFVNAAHANESLSTSGQSVWLAVNDGNGVCLVDPLAQTFLLSEGRQITGVDLWFDTVGTTTVLVQLRAVANGYPTRTVLAEARHVPADIAVGTHTRFAFDAPYYATANEEVAVVVLCNDSEAKVDVAELGKWDGSAWVSEQPYTVGVLLSSSNNLTWTAHQDRDLRFRVVCAKHTQTSRTVDLGVVKVDSVTDLMVMGLAQKPAAPADVLYRLTLPGGEIKHVPANVPVPLVSPVTGDIHVEAILKGNETVSPVLFPDGQLAYGWIGTTGDYVALVIPGGTNVRLRVVADALLPTGAAVEFRYRGADSGDAWSDPLPFLSSQAMNDGYVEMVFEATGISENFLQVKAVLTGTPAARPFLKNLRAMVI